MDTLITNVEPPLPSDEPPSHLPVSPAGRRRLAKEEYAKKRESVRKLYRDSDFPLSYISRLFGIPYSTTQAWCSSEAEAKARRESATGSRLRPGDEEEVLRLYEKEFHSIEAIAAKRGMPRSSVSRILHAHLTQVDRQRVAEKREELLRDFRISVVRRWAEGKASFRTLEKDLGIPRSTLSGWVRRPDLPADLRALVAERLPRNHRGPKERARPENAKSRSRRSRCEPRMNEPGHAPSAHEVQAMLGDIGVAAGFDVWIPANDRSRVEARMSRPGLCQVWPAARLPQRLDETVRNIDVTWLRDGIVMNCFEVEHSTSVTTGIARIRDAQEQFPNFLVRGYVVGSASKRRKFDREMQRPSLGSCMDRDGTRPVAFIDQDDLAGIAAEAASTELSPERVRGLLDEFASDRNESDTP